VGKSENHALGGFGGLSKLRMRAAAGGQGEQPRVACTNPWRCKGAGWCVLGQQGWWAVRGGCRAGIDRVEAACSDVMRSYQGYYTRSHQNSAVKRLWAGIVLGRVTSREVPVLHPHTLPFSPSLLFFSPPLPHIFLLPFLPAPL
jgi:hypothetical protein